MQSCAYGADLSVYDVELTRAALLPEDRSPRKGRAGAIAPIIDLAQSLTCGGVIDSRRNHVSPGEV